MINKLLCFMFGHEYLSDPYKVKLTVQDKLCWTVRKKCKHCGKIK